MIHDQSCFQLEDEYKLKRVRRSHDTPYSDPPVHSSFRPMSNLVYLMRATSSVIFHNLSVSHNLRA
jgi:hypothetical protein